MMEPRHEHFDHTADLGVRVWAPTLADLVRPATDGFYAAIGRLETAGAATPCRFELTGDDAALLLRDYLAELLHLFEHERRRLTDLDVLEFTEQRLVVAGQARTIDDTRSVFEREVKAITYHELEIRTTDDGYVATYIVDI